MTHPYREPGKPGPSDVSDDETVPIEERLGNALLVYLSKGLRPPRGAKVGVSTWYSLVRRLFNAGMGAATWNPTQGGYICVRTFGGTIQVYPDPDVKYGFVRWL